MHIKWNPLTAVSHMFEMIWYTL